MSAIPVWLQAVSLLGVPGKPAFGLLGRSRRRSRLNAAAQNAIRSSAPKYHIQVLCFSL